MLLLLVFAGMYTGIMEGSGMMDDVSRGLVSRLRTRKSFLLGAMGVSYFSAALASNQAMAVIIPARAMESKREELGVSQEEFAGALCDSGVPAAGIIPWNVMAVMCSGALQVAPLAYAPYTVLAIALPLFTIWRISRSRPADQSEVHDVVTT
jgi:NhaC family Na+:H+ antiporter